jgi:thiamine biosynthesis lipoprotein
MMKTILVIASIVVVIAAAGRFVARRPAVSSSASPGLIMLGGNTMGGTWSVKVLRLPPGASREELEGQVGALLNRLERQMSTYQADSDLSRFNASASTGWFPVPRELAEVVALARRVSDETDGAFDVTVGPLVNVWGFGAGRSGVPQDVPPAEAIAAAKARVDYRRLDVRLDPPALKKSRADLYVDLGGIAKGYAADAVGAFLESRTVSDYLAQIGGEVRARGKSHLGRPWHLGIETPTPDVRRVLAQVELADSSISTSGDYRNFFDVGGRRFSHEIEPRTGWPTQRGAASVSVIHSSGAYADAMATALMVLGPDDGLNLAKRMRLGVMFVTRGADRFDTRATDAFAARLRSVP